MVNVVSIVEFTVVTAISYKTYNTYLTTKRVWGNALTLALKFLLLFRIIYDVYRVSAAPLPTLQISFPYRRRRIPFLHGPYICDAGWAYIIHINILHRQIYHGRVLAGAGRRRGRRQGLRKQLHGLFARYVSYFERVAYFYCVTTMYIMYLHIRALYTRLVNFIYIFSTYLWRIADDGAGLEYMYIRTYTVRTRRSTIIIVTLRW